MSKSARCLKWGLLVFILVVRLVEICGKDQLHPDEVYSVMLAHCNPAFTVSLPPGQYTGLELQQSLLTDNPLTEDLINLYYDNADPPHASLYYMILRVCLTGMQTWNAAEVAFRGGLLNIFFLAIAYILMWRLASRFALGSITTTLICALAFLCPAAGNCVLLVREYQLATVAILWYAYSLYSIYNRCLERSSIGVCLMLSLIASIALALSTGYLNAFFLLLLPIGCILLLLWQHEPICRFLMNIALAGLCAVICSWCIYIGYFHFITVPTVHTAKAFADPITSLYAAVNRDIIKQVFTWPCFCLMIAIATYTAGRYIYKRKNAKAVHTGKTCFGKMSYMFVLFAVAVASVFLVQYASLLRESRYSYPFLPLMACILPFGLGGLDRESCKYLSLTLIGWFMAVPFLYPSKTDYKWNAQRKLLSHGAVISCLNPNELPLLYTVVAPEVTYTISDRSFKDLKDDAEAKVIVLNYSPEVPDSLFSKVRISGPLRVLTRKD